MFDVDGFIAPIVTPFTDDASLVSEARVSRLVRWTLDQGAKGLLICSECGEWRTMGRSERKTLLEYVMRDVQGRASVFAHVSVAGTAAALDLAQHARRHGARGVVLTPPEMDGLTQAEIATHVTRVAEFADLPVILSDPKRRLSPETLDGLADKVSLALAEPLRSVRNPVLTVSDTAASDEFVVDSMMASPLASLVPGLTRDTDPTGVPNLVELTVLLRSLGSARFLKAAMASFELEVGPNRSPLQQLLPDDAQRVRGFVQRMTQ